MLTPGPNGNAPKRWSPPPYAPPTLTYQAVRPQQLGQTSPITAAETLMRSPVIAFITDISAAAASAYLAYGLTHRRNLCLIRAGEKGYSQDNCPSTAWGTFWWIAATAMAVKALHDLSEMNT
jgi:hypothetical protein